ncbi:MAG: 50S ribosomal protein L35 [Pelolinea sp.]|nr:50S ribosomal protein L35 [Pelolinea sp.]
MPNKLKSRKNKLKTHKATSKRFRVTGSGKLVRSKGGKGHLRRNRSKRAKGMLDTTVPVEGKEFQKRIKKLLPYLDKNH